MEKFVNGSCSTTIHCALSYCVLGESKKTTIDYGTSSVEMEREKICLDNSHYLTRLKITNISGTLVKLLAGYPIITDDFSVGDKPSSQWEIFNGTRQLNDVPATCVLGEKDSSFAECVNRLSEEGAVQKDYRIGDTTLSGDMICVIKSGKQYVSLEVLTGDHTLNDISISSDCNGTVKAIRIGGEFNCLMEDGDVVYTDWVRISTGGNFMRLIEDYAETRKAMSSVNLSSDIKPSVYQIKEDFSHDSISEKLAFLKGLKAPFAYVELGNGWQNTFGDWESAEGINITTLAYQINKSGYKAGLWTAPFLVDKNSEFLETNKKWILRHADGSACTYELWGNEYFILDVSSEECLEHIEMMYQRLSATGFYMHNVDYTCAFAIQKDVVLLDPTVTVVQAYTKAMKTIKSSIGDSGYLYVSNGFLSPLTGIADTTQITSSVNVMSNRSKNNIIPRLINQASMRGFMSKWWHNTTSPIIDKEFTSKFSQSELRMFMVLEYLTGGMPHVIDISTADELKLLKCLMPAVQLSSNPRMAFDEGAFIKVVDVEVNKDYHTICFFNHSFSDVDLTFRLDNMSCGGYVDRSSDYNVSSYFGRIKQKHCGYNDIINMGKLSANSCEIVKIAKTDKPQVLFSDMHFSMGGEVEISTNGKTVSVKGNNPFNCKANYVVSLKKGDVLSDGREEFSFSVNGAGPFSYEKTIN